MKYVTVNIICKILHSRWIVVLRIDWNVLQFQLSGRYFTAGGQWYCGLNEVCYSEHYLEDTSQQADSCIAAWMKCVTVNIICKVLHCKWTVVLRLEWCVLHWTLSGRYFTAGGQCYCGLNEVCYSEHYLVGTSLQVDRCIAAWMKCVTLNIIWKVLHCMWTVVLRFEWSVLQWTLSGKYFTAGGQWHCGFNVVCYSEHYVVGSSQQVESGIATWIYFVTVNIIWKFLHSSWTVVLRLEWSMLQWTLSGRYFTVGGQWHCGMNVMLQWTLSGKYFTAGGH